MLGLMFGNSFIHSFIYSLRTIDKHDIKQITSRTARLTAALTTALNGMHAVLFMHCKLLLQKKLVLPYQVT